MRLGLRFSLDEGQGRTDHFTHLVDVVLNRRSQRVVGIFDPKGDACEWRAQVMCNGADHGRALPNKSGDARLHIVDRLCRGAQLGRALKGSAAASSPRPRRSAATANWRIGRERRRAKNQGERQQHREVRADKQYQAHDPGVRPLLRGARRMQPTAVDLGTRNELVEKQGLSANSWHEIARPPIGERDLPALIGFKEKSDPFSRDTEALGEIGSKGRVARHRRRPNRGRRGAGDDEPRTLFARVAEVRRHVRLQCLGDVGNADEIGRGLRQDDDEGDQQRRRRNERGDKQDQGLREQGEAPETRKLHGLAALRTKR